MRNLRSRRPARGGFSVAETLVVVAIIGMMVLVTTPAMINFWNSMKVRTAGNAMMSHLRLCRQISVSRRTPVILELQRTNGSVRPTYKAWEERSASGGDLVRQQNGADATANTADDENWVVRDEKAMATNGVKFVDCYNDLTPTVPGDDPGSSIMNGDGIMRLKFFANGTVQRVLDDNTLVNNDTQLRLRLRRKVHGTRVDQFDVTVNRIGKVGSDRLTVLPPE